MDGNACEWVRYDMKNGNNKVWKHVGVVRRRATPCDACNLSRMSGSLSQQSGSCQFISLGFANGSSVFWGLDKSVNGFRDSGIYVHKYQRVVASRRKVARVG
jgi:hypothetical protein